MSNLQNVILTVKAISELGKTTKFSLLEKVSSSYSPNDKDEINFIYIGNLIPCNDGNEYKVIEVSDMEFVPKEIFIAASPKTYGTRSKGFMRLHKIDDFVIFELFSQEATLDPEDLDFELEEGEGIVFNEVVYVKGLGYQSYSWGDTDKIKHNEENYIIGSTKNYYIFPKKILKYHIKVILK